MRSIYCLLHLTYITFVPEKFLNDLPGINPVKEAIKEIEATERIVRKFTDLCNSVLSGRVSLDINSIACIRTII